MSPSTRISPFTRYLLIACVIFVAAFGAFLYLRSLSAPTELEQAFAQRNRVELSDAALVSRLYSINLVSVSMPETASQATHRLADLTDPVLVRTSLPIPETDGTEFTVLLTRNGKPAFTAEGARVFRNPMGAEVRFLVPKQVLSAGQYRVIFDEVHREHENTSFQFTIE